MTMFKTRIRETSHRALARALLEVPAAERRDKIIQLAQFTGLSKQEVREYADIMLEEVKQLQRKLTNK